MKTLLNIISILSPALGFLGFFISKDQAEALEAAAHEGLLKIADAAKKHAWAVVIGLIGALIKLYDFIVDHLYLAWNVAPRIQNQWRNDPTVVVSIIQAIGWLLLVAVVAIAAYLALLLLGVLVCRALTRHNKGVIAGVGVLLSAISLGLKWLIPDQPSGH